MLLETVDSRNTFADYLTEDAKKATFIPAVLSQTGRSDIRCFMPSAVENQR